jgi:hypothetical protein
MSNEEEQKNKDADLAMVQKHCQQLIEHFDSVQIFVRDITPDVMGLR